MWAPDACLRHAHPRGSFAVHGDLYPGTRDRTHPTIAPTDALIDTHVRVSGESEPTPATLKSGVKLRHEPVWVGPGEEMRKSVGDPPKTHPSSPGLAWEGRCPRLTS